MANRKKRSSRASTRAARAATLPAATAPAAAAPTVTPACQLREVAGTPDFEAATGATVTLFTHDHIGSVLIAKAEYGGDQLVPASTAVGRISFKAKAGRNTLKLVCVFTASTTGNGELREDCGAGESRFVRPLFGDEPLQLIRITGK